MSHPAKVWDVPSLSNLAGRAAYSRFSDSVFWIFYDDDSHLIERATGDVVYDVDRIVSVLQSRHGSGANRHIGYRFNHDSLTFEEIGLIKKKKSGKSARKCLALV